MAKNNLIGFVLCESTSKSEETLIVSEKNNRVKIETIAQTAEETNRNGRIYKKSDLMSQINCDRTKELISTGNFFGEMGHPSSKDITRQATIDPTNICHKVSKIWMEGNNVKMITEGTQNDKGQVFNDLILSGTKPAFSLRALGSIQNTAKGAVVTNLKMICYDFVIYPSHSKAYMEKMINESVAIANKLNPYSIECNEGSKLILDDSDKGLVVPIMNKEVIDYVKNESANLKNVLNSFDTLTESIDIKNNYVQIVTKTGEVLMINLESYINREIMDYCRKL